MSSTGTLQIRTYTSDAQLPISGATVVVCTSGTPHRLLSLQITNASGLTAPIQIETPAPAGSTEPGTPKPFTPVIVIVDTPDYRQEVLENVQIFPGIGSNQTVELIPLEAFAPEWSLQDIIVLPDQPL